MDSSVISEDKGNTYDLNDEKTINGLGFNVGSFY